MIIIYMYALSIKTTYLEICIYIVTNFNICHERSYQQYSITSRQIGVIKLVRAQLVVRYVSTREVCVLFVFFWLVRISKMFIFY